MREGMHRPSSLSVSELTCVYSESLSTSEEFIAVAYYPEVTFA